MSLRAREDAPTLITAAEPSFAEQHAARQRKYFVMMGLRVPFLIAAALCHQIPWLAIGLLLLSIPLPWMAVLIANDRPPRKSAKVSWFRSSADTALIAGPMAAIESGDSIKPATK